MIEESFVIKKLLLIFVLIFSTSVSTVQGNDNYWVIAQSEADGAPKDNIYFSWLGCHSCLMIEQKVDLSGFDHLPLIARPDWRVAAKVQIALSMLEVDSEIVEQFKQKILDQKIDVKDLTQMIDALVALGVEQEALKTTLHSTELFAAVRAAEDKAKHYKIQYVPTAVVDGRYATDAKHTGSIDKFSETLKLLKNK